MVTTILYRTVFHKEYVVSGTVSRVLNELKECVNMYGCTYGAYFYLISFKKIIVIRTDVHTYVRNFENSQKTSKGSEFMFEANGSPLPRIYYDVLNVMLRTRSDAVLQTNPLNSLQIRH